MNSFEFSLSLRVFSKDVTVEEICAVVELSPKWTHKLGEPRRNPSGVLLGGSYEISYCSFPISLRPDEGLKESIQRATLNLEKAGDLFLKIRQGGGRIEFFVGWYSSGNTGEIFDSTLLKDMGNLGLDLSLDVYGDGKE